MGAMNAPPNTRYALVTADVDVVRAYLPQNYSATAAGHEVIISGADVAGWTLDGYVIPRLASGLYFAREVSATEADCLRQAVDSTRDDVYAVTAARDIRERLSTLLQDAYALHVSGGRMDNDWRIAVDHLARAGGAMKRAIEASAMEVI